MTSGLLPFLLIVAGIVFMWVAYFLWVKGKIDKLAGPLIVVFAVVCIFLAVLFVLNMGNFFDTNI